MGLLIKSAQMPHSCDECIKSGLADISKCPNSLKATVADKFHGVPLWDKGCPLEEFHVRTISKFETLPKKTRVKVRRAKAQPKSSKTFKIRIVL